MASYSSSKGDWTPDVPKRSQEKAEQLMSTEASDAKDTLAGTNALKAWVGKSGKPPTPYGVQGREF
jgi:hypothetical protein